MSQEVQALIDAVRDMDIGADDWDLLMELIYDAEQIDLDNLDEEGIIDQLIANRTYEKLFEAECGGLFDDPMEDEWTG